MQDNRFNLQQCHMVPNQSIKMFINVKKKFIANLEPSTDKS